MLCQFCGFDNSEIGLREGRCNRCGGQLQWNDSGSGDVTPEVQAAVAKLAAGIAPLQGAGKRADSEDFQAVAAALRGQGGNGGNGGRAAEPAAAPRGRGGAEPVETQELVDKWRQGIDTEAHPLRTLKGVSTSSVSDLPVFIHPRAVRRPADPEFGPSEYELLDVIGEGGVGIVYSARQSSIDRNVAVKMIRNVHESDQTTRDKFLAEAIVTGDLDHPNIVPVYDLGKDPTGSLFYSMKRVAGVPWSAAMSRKSQAENLDILMKVADAIAFAHARGVVHRDIKPENVMLGEFGEVLVMDWGIALPMSSYRKSGGVLLSQGLGGTPAYMAPEMATGPLSKISPASDVYLLGAVLYEIVSGHPPHRGADVMSCVLAAAKNEIVPTDKGGELIDIAMRAMAKKPEDRYPSVQAFQKEVRSYQSHLESVVLGERAGRQLDEARRTGSYDDFARAVFAYEEALTLWSGNENARRGRSESRREFAECALYKGDFDLGLSQADTDDPEHVDVIVRLRAALSERQARDSRFRAMRGAIVFLGVVALVGGAVFTGWIYWLMLENADKTKEALTAQEAAEKGQELAETEREKAETAEGKAKDATKQAVEARDTADKERQNAERNEALAVEERFFAEVGIVNERIEGNSFDVAREILKQHVGTNRSPLRHWEWGRLDYLVQGGRAGEGVVQTGRTGVDPALPWTIESMAISGDDRTAVVVSNAGQVEVWSIGDMRRLAHWDAGHVIIGSAINQDGTLIATVGGSVDKGSSRGLIRVWRRAGSGYEQAAESPTLEARVHAAAFSPNGKRLVAGGRRGSEMGSAYLWDWEQAGGVTRLAGQLDTIWSATFSPDGKRVATAGEDKTVRIWDAATAAERQRFLGHDSVVYCVAFSHDGRRLASGDYDGRVLVWPIDESAALRRRLADDVKKRIDRQDPAAPVVERQIQAHSASVLTVGFSRDDGRLVTGAQDNVVKIWSLAGDAPATTTSSRAVPESTLRGHGGWVRAARLLGDSDSLTVVSGAMDHAWRRWDVTRYEEEIHLAGKRAKDERAANLDAGEGFIRAIYAAGGRAIVAAERTGGRAWLWSVQDRTLAKSLVEGHEFLVSKAFTSPDGSRLYTVAGDGEYGTLRGWDLARGVEEQVLQPIGRRGLAVPSSDGRFVLTGGRNKTATWWDLSTGRVVHHLDPHAADANAGRAVVRPASLGEKKIPEITTLAVSRDASLLSTGDESGWCRIWDARTGQLRRVWRCHEFDLTGAAFVPSVPGISSGGTLLLTASTDQAMFLWDVSQDPPKQVAAYHHLDPIWSLAVSPDGRRVVTTSSVRLSEAKSEELAATSKKKRQKVPGLWLWDLTSKQPKAQFPIWERLAEQGGSRDIAVNSLTWSAETADVVFVATTDQKSSRQELWQWNPTRASIAPAKLPAGARGTFGSGLPLAGGTRLITAGGRGARLWDLVEGREEKSFTRLASVNALAASADGRWLVVAGKDGSTGVADLWSLPEDLQAARKHQRLMGSPQRPLTAVAFTPTSDQLYAADESGEIRRWSVERSDDENSKPVFKVGTAVRDLKVTSDGRRLVVVGDDAQVRLIDLKTGQVSAATGHTAPILCAALSNDGRWLLTGSEDRTAIIWDLGADSPLLRVATLVGHSAGIDGVAFSPDGLRALTGSRDSTAKVWNLFPVVRRPAGEREVSQVHEVLTLPPHEREVIATAFSPDGLDVLTAGADAALKLWPGNPLPPSFEFSPGGIEYEVGAPAKLLDDGALISRPNPVAGERLEISLRFEKALRGDELLVTSRTTPLGELEARDGRLTLRATGAEAAIEIGTYQPLEPADTLTLKFVPDLPPSFVQAAIRSVAYQNLSDTAEITARKVIGHFESSSRTVDMGVPPSRTIQLAPKLKAEQKQDEKPEDAR